MSYVVEMTGFDKVAAVEKTVLFAMGEGIAFTDTQYAPGALMKWESATQRIDISTTGRVSIASDGGEIMLGNFPDTVLEAGPWDVMADWVWQNRTATLYWVDGPTAWAGRSLMATGTMEQPIATLSAGGKLSSVLRFQLRDPRAALDTPLQPNKFAGTNVLPAGVEGGASLKGKPKPVLYGLVSNFSPPLVNESLLIYQISDKGTAATALPAILCVRDGGVSLGVGTIRASLATLMSNIPLGGRYDIYRGAEGTFIRLGSSPTYGIAVDADEASTEANQSHANIWSRIRAERVGGTTNAASIVAANALDVAGAGFYWDTEVTQKAALDEVLGSFSGFELQNLDGSWSVAKLVIPSGTPALILTQILPTTRRVANTRALLGIERVRPTYASNGAPPFRINIEWGRNYTTMGTSDFGGVVGPRLREKFGQEYRTVSVQDNLIWDPVAKTGPWKNAPEITISTAYQPGNDGIVSPGAAAEASRILALLSPLRGQYQTKHIPAVGDNPQVGQVVQTVYPRFGMAAGALFRILGAGLTVEYEKAVTDLVIGLQV